jgi:hypothetical protein
MFPFSYQHHRCHSKRIARSAPLWLEIDDLAIVHLTILSPIAAPGCSRELLSRSIVSVPRVEGGVSTREFDCRL